MENLSSILQRVFQVPVGLLLQSPEGKWGTRTYASWNFNDSARKEWARKMDPASFRQWTEIVSPIGKGTVKAQKPLDGQGTKKIADFICENPGLIFAIRVGDNPLWHHPCCQAISSRIGNDIHFKDLMGAGVQWDESHLSMWLELGGRHCCGSIWKMSFIHWGDGDSARPPKMRLMTLVDPSPIWEKVSQDMAEYEDNLTVRAKASAGTWSAMEGGPWHSSQWWRKELMVDEVVYRGNVFQPELFIGLCEKLKLFSKRKLFEAARHPENFFGVHATGEDDQAVPGVEGNIEEKEN
jgi:hypothetical protein